MDTELDALATALYVEVDDFVILHPELVPWRPEIGIKPQVSDAELITLGVMAVLLQFDNETRWVRHARARLSHLFPYLPQQSGYNKRMRKLTELMAAVMAHLAATTSVFTDDPESAKGYAIAAVGVVGTAGARVVDVIDGRPPIRTRSPTAGGEMRELDKPLAGQAGVLMRDPSPLR